MLAGTTVGWVAVQFVLPKLLEDKDIKRSFRRSLLAHPKDQSSKMFTDAKLAASSNSQGEAFHCQQAAPQHKQRLPGSESEESSGLEKQRRCSTTSQSSEYWEPGENSG